MALMTATNWVPDWSTRLGNYVTWWQLDEGQKTTKIWSWWQDKKWIVRWLCCAHAISGLPEVEIPEHYLTYATVECLKSELRELVLQNEVTPIDEVRWWAEAAQAANERTDQQVTTHRENRSSHNRATEFNVAAPTGCEAAWNNMANDKRWKHVTFADCAWQHDDCHEHWFSSLSSARSMSPVDRRRVGTRPGLRYKTDENDRHASRRDDHRSTRSPVEFR